MTEQEKLINVDLYGDGSRDSRLRAEYIYCDHADVCSVYKEGKCFRKTTLFGVRCEFGRIACVDGGTKKTKMYGRVYSEAKDSERYHKVSTRTPPLISLYFCQERGDPDYGSCLWAVFNFDLERYELSITSDCGNYAYGWVPTHKSESFMHLMARLDSGYLLDKLASPCVINEEATFEAVKELMEAWGVDFSETDRWGDPVFDMDEIKDCCYQSNERDVHDALERKFEGTSMETCDDYDLWSCIQKDFTTNAKKIVQVFMDHIRPMCKKLSLSDVQIAEADKDGRLVALPSDKALTNADRMRAATSQQLAKLLYDNQKEFCRLMYKNLGFEDELTFSEDYSDILAWLNAPAEMGVVQDKDE